MDFLTSEVLLKETEEKAPPDFAAMDFDFTRHDAPAPGTEPDPENPRDNEPPGDFNPGESAESYLMLYEILRGMGWNAAYQRKLRDRYFNDPSEIARAEELMRMTPGELEKSESAEANAFLLERYKKYLTRLQARIDSITLTEEERIRLRKPLEKLAEKYKGINVPPEAAILLAMIMVEIPRMMMYKQEF